MEAKGLRVNMPNTKVMICAADSHPLNDSGKHPCAVCRIRLLGVTLFFVMAATSGCIRNAVESKADSNLILSSFALNAWAQLSRLTLN